MASDHPTRSDCYCPACTGDCHGCGEKHDRIVELESELALLRAESMRGAVEGYASAVEKLRHCPIVTGSQPLEKIRDAVAVWLEAHAPEQQAASQGQPECAECGGSGVAFYPSTVRGKGGQAFTERPCEKCQPEPEPERERLKAFGDAIRALLEKWRIEQGSYPEETDERALFAARCLSMCRRELQAALINALSSEHIEEGEMDTAKCRASQTAAMRGEKITPAKPEK